MGDGDDQVFGIGWGGWCCVEANGTGVTEELIGGINATIPGQCSFRW